MDKRSYPRFPFNDPVVYKTGDFSSTGSLAVDLSQGGVRIRVQKFIALRTVVSMNIHLNDPVRMLPVKGQVVWVREVPHSEIYDVGIRFLEEQNIKKV